MPLYKSHIPNSIFDSEQRQDALFRAKVIAVWRGYCCVACCKRVWPEDTGYLSARYWISRRPHPSCIPGVACKSCKIKLAEGREVNVPPLDFGPIPEEVKKLSMYQRSGLSSLEPTNALRRAHDAKNKIAFHYNDFAFNNEREFFFEQYL